MPHPHTKYQFSNSSLSPATLAHTSELLRYDNPSLAGAVQNALATLTQLPPQPRNGSRADHWPLNAALIASLEPQTVGKVLAALTELGNRVSDQWAPEEIAFLQELLQDWVDLTEWLLRCADEREFDAFH